MLYDNFTISKNVVLCPECGNEMNPGEGCLICVYCGFSFCE